MPSIQALMTVVGFVCLGLAAGYALVSVVAVLVWRMQGRPNKARSMPPVTVLKPLCGAERGLHEHLRSFCRQDYPEFQIVFGVRDAGDPACAVVKRLAAEFPSVPIELVINPQLHGTNLKISNLINMPPYAPHDILPMPASHPLLSSDYLATSTPPLLHHNMR